MFVYYPLQFLKSRPDAQLSSRKTCVLRGSIGPLPKFPDSRLPVSNTGGVDCYARRVPEAEDGKEVLASLPRRRPGIQSPRRAAARAAAERASAETPPGTAAQGPRSELEELARAGVRLAGGVTAAGLKLAGRTVGGLGRVVGRR